jgi:hypothetical protein
VSDNADKNAQTLSTMQSQMDRLQRSADPNNPADAALIKQWQNQIDTFQSASESQAKRAQALKGQNVDPTQVKTFTDKTLASYSHIPGNEKQALAIEASQARTDTEFRQIEGRADASEQAHANLQEKYAEVRAGKETAQSQKAGEENEKYWSDPQHGFVAPLQQSKQIEETIKGAKDGNGLMTNMLPTMTVLGVNSAAGVHRISPAEAEAAKLNPQVTVRWNAMFDAATKGATPAQLAQQARELNQVVIGAAHDKALAQSQFNAKSHGTPYSSVPVMDVDGNVTTLDKLVVKDPNGKEHAFHTEDQANQFKKAIGQ